MCEIAEVSGRPRIARLWKRAKISEMLRLEVQEVSLTSVDLGKKEKL